MAEFLERMQSFMHKYVFDVLAEIRPVDILDILILSVLIFSIFKFIKERRAGRLALGLGIFALILIVSVALNLKAMKYILENFYQIGLLAIVIIFQSDLRAALEKVGNTPIRTFKKNFTESDFNSTVELAEIISDACNKFSAERTGALIVLELETKLGDYMSQGTIINADTSVEMLRTIFYEGTALHDGATIIRNRRIYASGCFLPISQADVNKDLGTRHRAALGLSEVSDAVVIVVSEETGTISIAKDGQLSRFYTYATLKQAIVEYLAPEEVRRERQKNMRRNLKRGMKDE